VTGSGTGIQYLYRACTISCLKNLCSIRYIAQCGSAVALNLHFLDKAIETVNKMAELKKGAENLGE
jgi:hypothetical protein